MKKDEDEVRVLMGCGMYKMLMGGEQKKRKDRREKGVNRQESETMDRDNLITGDGCGNDED